MPSTFQIAAQQKTKQIHIACMQLFVAFECMDFWDTVWINITRNLMRLSTFVSTKCTQCEKNKKKKTRPNNKQQSDSHWWRNTIHYIFTEQFTCELQICCLYKYKFEDGMDVRDNAHGEKRTQM